jgi:hypothetical protein
MKSHTYLHHIIQNYDSLARCTIFAGGGIAAKERESASPKLDKLLYVLDNIDRCEDEGVVIMAGSSPGQKIVPFPRDFTIKYEAPPVQKHHHFKSCKYEERNSEKCLKMMEERRNMLNGETLVPAEPHTLGRWYKKWVPFDSKYEKIGTTGICYGGIFAASRASR